MDDPLRRLRGEPPHSYNNFLAYVQLGSKRSLSKAYQVCHANKKPSKTYLEAAKRWSWYQRACAYDSAQLKIAIEGYKS